MFRRYLKIIRMSLLVIGVLLSFFAVLEIIRAYNTLRELHPHAGYAFVGVLVLGLVLLFGRLFLAMARRPPVLVAPAIPDREQATAKQLRRYGRYLGKYIRRLSRNELFSKQQKQIALGGLASLRKDLGAAPDGETLLKGIRNTEETTIEPLLSVLDEKAARQVRDCVRDVMLGVTISPYKAADLLIVLYRNTAMVSGIIRVYHSRPRLREQLRVFRDVMRIVATVNFLNLGKKVLENVFSKLPGGQFVDDVAQGIGAGLMTSVAGHAAIARCRAFRAWDEEEARASVRQHLGQFSADVRSMVLGDLKDKVKDKVRSFFWWRKKEEPAT